MEHKTKGLIALREIDILQERIDALKREQQAQHDIVSECREKIKTDNASYIGKNAYCSMEGNPNFQNVLCKCTDVSCTKQFTIRPLFSRVGKKVLGIDYYDWVS